ncbi:MAG: phosphoribosylformylglycinamidine synthase subunit PurL [Candidatus Sumerlaeia bacterium]|nr:phosphoribosylformylglycinamidine synthase subunit PurL [Candidatus Sumerlaeia bacterium]
MNLAAAITPDLVAGHGLRPAEFDSIVQALGRDPTLVELGIYSVMWSEHCAYKHSRPLLRTLPTRGERVVVGPGENAGVIDIGGGLCVAFKMESHNHPSAVEPYQGAATGVGGILRDIFTMGARPIALLDNLRFGEPDAPHMRHLIEGVVEGIAGYGNCVGVPTVGGDIMFDPGHAGNILVNVMCVGLVRTEHIRRGQAHGPGNAVLYFGSPTGRDGIHGATFASGELSEEALERRSAVQVGDPFMGKRILECTLELIERGLVVGIQDMGAAGLTCSTCEMAGRAGTGIEIDLDRVPQRAPAMSAYEILLSESQERMLAVCEQTRLAEVLEVCERWECGGVVIGQVTGSGRVEVHHRGEVVASIPANHLTHGAPVYHPPEAAPAAPEEFDLPPVLPGEDFKTALLALLASPTIASKRWAYRRYDHMVQIATVLRPGDADAAVLRLPGPGEPRFLAVTSGGNHRLVARDPRAGAALAVLEAARNLVCTGAQPLAITNCLNFGSPERPEVFGQLRRAIEGIAGACRALDIPVTGGNVSLYNESGGVAIPPTPIIGMVGLIEREEHITRPGWREPGDVIYVLGDPAAGLGGSELAKYLVGGDLPGVTPRGPLPPIAIDREVALLDAVRSAILAGLIRSAHDVSDGGLAVTLAECCLLSRGGHGAWIHETPDGDLALTLFGELPPRVVVSVRPADARAFEALISARGVACAEIGLVGLPGLRCADQAAISHSEMQQAHETPPWESLR